MNAAWENRYTRICMYPFMLKIMVTVFVLIPKIYFSFAWWIVIKKIGSNSLSFSINHTCMHICMYHVNYRFFLSSTSWLMDDIQMRMGSGFLMTIRSISGWMNPTDIFVTWLTLLVMLTVMACQNVVFTKKGPNYTQFRLRFTDNWIDIYWQLDIHLLTNANTNVNSVVAM